MNHRLKDNHEPEWTWRHAAVGLAIVLTMVLLGGDADAHVIAHTHQPVTPPAPECFSEA